MDKAQYQLVNRVGLDDSWPAKEPGTDWAEAGRLLYTSATKDVVTDASIARTVEYLAQRDDGTVSHRPGHLYDTPPVFQGELFQRHGGYLLTWRGNTISLWRVVPIQRECTGEEGERWQAERGEGYRVGAGDRRAGRDPRIELIDIPEELPGETGSQYVARHVDRAWAIGYTSGWRYEESKVTGG